MYSFSNGSFLLIKRCPLTQVTSIYKYTYTNFMTRSPRVITALTNNKTDQQVVKRNISDEGTKNHFKLPNINVSAILNQSKELIRDVRFSELNNAPLPAFWYGFGGLAPFVLPPLSFIILGYSPFLGTLQLTFGATICSFLGGIRWGYLLKDDSYLTWESLGWAVIPQCVAWLSLLMPQTLGFLMVSGGLLASGFGDLTRMKYPDWFRAMRLCLTIPAVISLLLTGLMCLFH